MSSKQQQQSSSAQDQAQHTPQASDAPVVFTAEQLTAQMRQSQHEMAQMKHVLFQANDLLKRVAGIVHQQQQAQGAPQGVQQGVQQGVHITL